MTIEKSHLGDKCGELSKEKMDKVDKALQISLGLDDRLRIIEP